MRLLAFIIAIAAFASCSSKKVVTKAPLVADSIDIHRVGGVAGFSDHYRITNGKVWKADGKDASVAFEQELPAATYDKVKRILSAIPAKMYEENGRTYGTTVTADGMEYDVRTYSKGIAYHWIIRHDAPEYVNVFLTQLNETFGILATEQP
jgi:hypothetical protein